MTDSAVLVRTGRTMAIVGLSENPQKDSFLVAKYLQQHGFQIIPVHPRANEILGEKAFATLDDIPPELAQTIDIIDFFRPSDEIPSFLPAVIRLHERFGKLRGVWLQLGIENNEMKTAIQSRGLLFVQNKCIKIEHARQTRN